MSCRTPHGLTLMSETQTAKGTSSPPPRPTHTRGLPSGSVRRCQARVQVPRGSGWSGHWRVGELVKANDPF